MSIAEFTAAYEAHFDRLCDYLGRKFPRLDRAACEDIVQLASVDALKKIREGFRPNTDWPTWLRWKCSKLAIDYIRRLERRVLEALASGRNDYSAGAWEPAGVELPPSQVLLEHDRRGQQTLVLSDVLREFCRLCESQAMHKHKEVYERSLRGQKPAEIAAATGLTRNNVDQHLKRARDWVLNRIRQSDVDRSVFCTLHRRRPQEGKRGGS